MSLSAFNIRLPLELKTWVSPRAEENGRSLNSDIVQMIKTQQRLDAITDDVVASLVARRRSDTKHGKKVRRMESLCN